jgi:hypothetical protein
MHIEIDDNPLTGIYCIVLLGHSLNWHRPLDKIVN